MIHLDDEFKNLIPPLSHEEFQQLEENCVSEGIRDPLVVWKSPDGKDILIDGHNRFRIAAKHSLHTDVVYKEFKDRSAVINWIILNQFGRRNLNAYTRSVLALKLKPVIEKDAHQRKIEHVQNSSQAKTRDSLAAIAGVSHDTIHKVETIEREATENTKEKVRAGEISVNQAYNSLKQKSDKNSILRQAEQEHAEFSEKKNESVVSFEDIKTENENKKILAAQFASEILGAINRIEKADFKAGSTKYLIDVMEKGTMEALLNSIGRAEIIFSRLKSFLEVK